MWNGRGTYRKELVGADHGGGSSVGTWIVGGLLVGGFALWARHQQGQIEKLYAQAGLPYQSFAASLRERSKELSSSAREKVRGISQRFRTKKES